MTKQDFCEVTSREEAAKALSQQGESHLWAVGKDRDGEAKLISYQSGKITEGDVAHQLGKGFRCVVYVGRLPAPASPADQFDCLADPYVKYMVEMIIKEMS